MTLRFEQTIPSHIIDKLKKPYAGKIYDASILKEFDVEIKNLFTWLVREYRNKQGVNDAASENYLVGQRMNDVESKLFTIGEKLSDILRMVFPEISRGQVFVISIPRSGWAIGQGVGNNFGTPVHESNQGALAKPSQVIFDSSSIPQSATVLIVDDCLFQGRSLKAMERVLESRKDLKIFNLVAMCESSRAVELQYPVIALYKYDEDF